MNTLDVTEQPESANAGCVQRVVSRREFERWAKEPPREWPLRICPESGAWPGQYMPYYVQCAWEAWCEAANEKLSHAAGDRDAASGKD